MRYLLFALLILGSVLPLSASAHGVGEVDATAPFVGVQKMEDRMLGEELHEEMESLMQKMMADRLTDDEAARMVELMNRFPGAGSMMMGRMMGMGGFGAGDGAFAAPVSRMPWGGGVPMIAFWVLVAAGVFVLMKYASVRGAQRALELADAAARTATDPRADSASAAPNAGKD